MDPISANLLTVAVPVAVGAFIVVVLATRRRGGGAGTLTRAESWAASLVGAGAMMSALFGVIGLISNASWIFDVEPFRVDDMAYLGTVRPELLDGVDHVAASGYQSVWIDVMGLPEASRWLFYLELALPLLSGLAISIAVAWLSFAVVRERPFARSFPTAIGITAIAVMVAGLGSQFAGALARTSVIDYLGAEQLTGHDASVAPADVLSYFSLSLDLAPVGWAFGLALVAAAFQIGTRLQRDTEALV
ncbi:hypothetical protein [Microbacterium sp. CFBP9034]|uniref:hypothetical protein n=1 Tax=Microbacterium sp. CFBP9034 TaxID=3096540 RepID=UPI002A6B22AA|nr:hypothetical protein [Microbacterium sp. CFBP9034]MDY0907881.1 hypothetical protein [Microbacterium sp. CFBP9034]